MATIVIKDKNLVPENIKKGVTILKVTGTLEGGGRTIELQSKTVDSSTEKQTVTYDSGYDGLKDVTVEAYELDSKTVNSSTSQQVVTSSADGLSSVTVNPYTLDTKTVDPSTSQQVINSSADGLSSVTVTAVTSSIDQNISAGNIKKDVTILGVTGTFEGGGSAPVLQDVSVSYSQNGSYTLEASSGYDGLGTLDISVNVPSQGGEPWYIQAKKGQITDVSNCSFGGLEQIPYGAAYAVAGSAITTAPQLNFTSVADHGMEGAFAGCTNMGSVDVSVYVDGSLGGYAFENMFRNAHINSLTFDASTINSTGQFALNSLLYDATVNNDIVFTCSEITGNYAFYEAFNNLHGSYGATISFPNLTTVHGQYVFYSAFVYSRVGTVSIPNLVNVDNYSLNYMLNTTVVNKLVCNPIILRDESEDNNPLTDAADLYEIEFSANATDNVYLKWQRHLTPGSVYNILTHLDLNTSGKIVSFAGYYDYQWDDEQETEVEVIVDNLVVYDYPDGRIQTAYDAAVNAGWDIQFLTIIPTDTAQYINTNGDTITTEPLSTIKTTVMSNLTENVNTALVYYDVLFKADSNYTRPFRGIHRTLDNAISLSSPDDVYVLGSYTRFNNSLEGYYVGVCDDGRPFNYDSNSDIYYYGTNGTALENGTGNNPLVFFESRKNYTVRNIKVYENFHDVNQKGTLVNDYIPVSYVNQSDENTYYGLFDIIRGKMYTGEHFTGA